MLEGFQEAARAIRAASEEWQRSLQKIVLGMRETVQAASRDLRVFIDLLSDAGWPMPGEIPLPLVWEIVEEHRAGNLSASDIPGIFVSYYGPEAIAEMESRWAKAPIFAPRIHILRDALRAHVAGTYTLSVPALLSQLEGVVVDAFRHRGRFSGAHLRSYIRELWPGDQEDTLGGASDARIRDTLTAVVYEGFFHGEPLLKVVGTPFCMEQTWRTVPPRPPSGSFSYSTSLEHGFSISLFPAVDTTTISTAEPSSGPSESRRTIPGVRLPRSA